MTGRRLFRLRRDHPELGSGDYRLLESGPHNVICLACFDTSELGVAVVNAITAAKDVILFLPDIMSGWQDPSAAGHAYYTHGVLLLKKPAGGWTTEIRDSMSAWRLLQGGISASVEPIACQVIRLCLGA